MMCVWTTPARFLRKNKYGWESRFTAASCFRGCGG